MNGPAWLRMGCAGLLLVLSTAVGCRERPARGAPSTPSEARVRLGYFANLTHAQAVLGVASGDYQKALGPVPLTTKVYNAGPSLIESLYAGEIDIGYVGPGPAAQGFIKSKGTGVRVIAGVSSGGVLIVARPGSGIKTLADLKGRTIATPQLANTQDVVARYYVIHQLGQPHSRNVIAIANAEQSTLMQRGQLDVAWSPEPWGSRLIAEAKATIVAQEDAIWPGGKATLAVVVVRPQFLQEHPDLVEKLLVAHCAWTKRLQDRPLDHVKPFNEALRGLTGKKLPEKVLQSALRHTRFTDDPIEQSLLTMAKWTKELGFTDDDNLTGLVDLTILHRLQEKP